MDDSPLGSIVVALAATVGVAALQPRLARIAHEVKEGADIYALPPPEELRAATLGYHAAAVDVLWAKLLVEYGTHWSEHREFKDVPKYVDAILALESDYPLLYRYVDTMLVYRPLQGTEDDARRARAYLQQGTTLRSDDARLWTQYGQFLAFIGPSFLHDPAERDAWRRDGAAAMGHAAELGADPDRALTASSMLTRAGQTREAIRYLERAYAFTEERAPEVHEAIGRRLVELEAGARRDAADAATRAVDARWQSQLPIVSRGHYLLLGPLSDPLRCAGLGAVGQPECVRAWPDAIAGDAPADVSEP